MIAAIAYIRGYNLDSDRVRAMVIACLLGGKAIDVLKEAGINIGANLVDKGLGRIPGWVFLKVNHAVGIRLITKGGSTGILNLPKLIPVVGGLISGAIDTAFTRTIASAAKGVFPASRE